jgi:hypothetical protein
MESILKRKQKRVDKKGCSERTHVSTPPNGIRH